MVNNLLADANAQQIQADTAVEQLVAGKSDSVHDVVLAVAKADLSFRAMTEVRNKLVTAYQDIMNMPV